MSGNSLTRARAIHPHWTGFLVLSPTNGTLVHEATGNRASYSRNDDELLVCWEDYPVETFILHEGVWLHSQVVASAPDLQKLQYVKSDGALFALSEISVLTPGGGCEVALRAGTTDAAVFWQIMVRKEYESPYFPPRVNNIVDLGANIGLSAVFFASKYPDCSIYCVEPDSGNFEVLQRNVRDFGSRLRCRQAAVWTSDGMIGLEYEDSQSASLGAWGLRVAAASGHKVVEVPSVRMDAILADSGFQSVDLLKVDIEGAELELFADPDLGWLNRIEFIAIETHDNFKPGSAAAVRAALERSFQELPPSGENLLFRRR